MLVTSEDELIRVASIVVDAYENLQHAPNSQAYDKREEKLFKLLDDLCVVYKHYCEAVPKISLEELFAEYLENR